MKNKMRQQGQVLTEFVIMTALILVITAAVLIFFNVFTDYGNRAVSTVAVDYP